MLLTLQLLNLLAPGGTNNITGTGALEANPVTVTGSGDVSSTIQNITGTGVLVVTAVQVAGSGKIGRLGSGAIVTNGVVLAATALLNGEQASGQDFTLAHPPSRLRAVRGTVKYAHGAPHKWRR